MSAATLTFQRQLRVCCGGEIKTNEGMRLSGFHAIYTRTSVLTITSTLTLTLTSTSITRAAQRVSRCHHRRRHICTGKVEVVRCNRQLLPRRPCMRESGCWSCSGALFRYSVLPSGSRQVKVFLSPRCSYVRKPDATTRT